MKFGFKRQITVLIPISVYTLYSVIMFMTFIYNSLLPSKENWMITKSRVEPNKFLPRWEEISITRNSSLSQRRVKRRFDHMKFIEDKTNFSSELEVKYPRVFINNEGLGQNGTGVIINKTSLDHENQKLLDEGYKLHAFNSYVSNLISVDRRPPHVRDPLCKTQTFPEDLPETSVIITFLNEAWSVLVRSVHSVINTTPPTLLKEIILVDDFSDYDYLKESLDVYMRRFPKITVIHNKKREGLIRSRLNGAKIATGKVLTFLDSHIECAEDWLPPLLARIKENPKHVVWPSISSINKDTFQFKNAPSAANQNTGIFTWRLDFTWEPPNIAERDSPISPIRSPTMAGGIFSIDRRYFYHIGSYDDQMMLWGAENLELSFRIWMCGGTIEIIPCSVVGHVFRRRNVNFNQSNLHWKTYNTIRTAVVWMDDYKYIYSKVASVPLENYGDIRFRLELRRKLNCKSFQWYLDNIYTTVFIPTKALKSGLVRIP